MQENVGEDFGMCSGCLKIVYDLIQLLTDPQFAADRQHFRNYCVDMQGGVL
jgi:hypothetical protein